MAATNEPLTVKLDRDWNAQAAANKVIITRSVGERLYEQELAISFERTVRVVHNDETNELPPCLGTFLLYKVKDYSKKLPAMMAAKGGFFFPMYQREAMWMSFSSSDPFAVKVYFSGVNAVSGESAKETGQTMMRRFNLLEKRKSIQDYVVAPDQLWLDGIASSDGKVRQFVAMPLGSGYSVEAQITGEEMVGGLQIEVTPSKVAPHLLKKLPPPPPPSFGPRTQSEFRPS